MSDEAFVRVVGKSGRVMRLPSKVASGMLRNPGVRLADEAGAVDYSDATPTEDLSALSLAELKEQAKERGVSLGQARTKAQIAELLTASES